MRKQLVAAVIAVLLAVVGVFSLVSYAQGADDRAFAGTKRQQVLRLTADVPAGTPVSRLAPSVETVEVPAAAVVPGALDSLDGLAGKVTTAPLMRGEQLLAARFGSSATPEKKATGVPDGMQEVSVTVALPRVAGGKLSKGDRVGFIASYPRKNGDAGDTNVVLNRLLVTRVSNATLADTGDGAGAALLVTFAVKTEAALKIVNASEFGKVWLTLQNDKTDTDGNRRLNAEDVI